MAERLWSRSILHVCRFRAMRGNACLLHVSSCGVSPFYMFAVLGACEGTLACSTCHLVFKQTDFEKLHEKATDEELDMLDLAYGLSETLVFFQSLSLSKVK